ncbi:MAG TPA: GNAT family N-acetyltransferase [Gaiellaceae bacterium]
MIRRADTDGDLAGWCEVWNAITPREPTRLEDVKRRLERQPERLYLVALEEQEVVGLGFCGPSQSPERTAVVVRVLPEHRRRGIGSELLDLLIAHAAGLARPRVSGMVFEDDPESIAWVTNRGFEEYDRQVELSRELGPTEGEPQAPSGIELAELDESRHEEAYAVWAEGYPDMPVSPAIPAPTYEEWLEEEVSGPVTFVALDAAHVVGAAALLERVDGLAEHGLTAVRRSHRGRGIATALKQALIHWAAQNGYRELTTWTQDGNAAMQAVNLKLGYRPRPAVINVWREL